MRIVIPAVVLLALVACQAPQKFQVAPSIEPEERFGPDPELEGAPWSVGAFVTIGFDAYGQGVVVETTDPAVVALGFSWVDEETGQVGAVFDAVAPGEAEVVAYDRMGNEVDRRTIAVREPVTADLHASGPLTLRMPSEDTLADGPHILVNGVSSFEIRWYDGTGDRLHPPAQRTVSGSDGVWVESWAQYGRDWVRISPSGEGDRFVTLRHGEDVLTTWTVTGIPTSDVTSVDLIDQDTDDVIRSILAVARGADGEPVWGTRFDWSVQGRPISTQGDVYRYTFDRDVDVPLAAAYLDLEEETRLHGFGGPTDSTALGCAVPLPFPGPAAAALALLFVRRRRG